MLIESLRINNYRSIRHLSIEMLSQIGVLICPNNVGKSTIIDALAYLSWLGFGRGQARTWDNLDALLPKGNRNLSLEFHLGFAPSDLERRAYLDILVDLGYEGTRVDEIMESDFFRALTCTWEAAGGNPHELLLKRAEIKDEHGSYFAIVQPHRNPNQYSIPKDLDANFRSNPRDSLSRNLFLARAQPSKVNLNAHNGDGLRQEPGLWPLGLVADYFASIYFLNPYRHAPDSLTARYQPTLTSDGSNLPVVLNYLSGADTVKFERVKHFMEAALPDLGLLHSAILSPSDHLQISFRDVGDFEVALSHMGSGVEQLLMVGTVFATQRTKPNIFVEEPETHLHPGAQRFLLEQLRSNANQAIISTHSPVFVDSGKTAVVRVSKGSDGTKAETIIDTPMLNRALREIGAKNSDVLFADAVVFVEGPSDAEVVAAWSVTLNRPLSLGNVALVPIGGGRYAERAAPDFEQGLLAVSEKAPVPHLFVIDRDERDEQEVRTLTDKFGGTIHILDRREIENYFLEDPAAIRSALFLKYPDNPTMRNKLEGLTDDRILEEVNLAVDGAKNLVFAKRLRKSIGGVLVSLISDQALEREVSAKTLVTLPRRLRSQALARLRNHVSEIDFQEIVTTHATLLEQDWQEPKRRLQIAPGSEVLDSVFKTVGSRYQKRTDGARIAASMSADTIPAEVAGLIGRIHALSSI